MKFGYVRGRRVIEVVAVAVIEVEKHASCRVNLNNQENNRKAKTQQVPFSEFQLNGFFLVSAQPVPS